MRFFIAIALLLSLFGVAHAQTTTAATTSPSDAMLDFGDEGLRIPPVIISNAHAPRTAQLLGEAYRRKEPLVWRRAQYVADLGRVALPAATPFLLEAMKDPAAQVRAEAARSAGRVGDEALMPGLAGLARDADAGVRREAVLAAMTIARQHDKAIDVTGAIGDNQPAVVAAAIHAAWTPQHAAIIAQKLATLPDELKTDAAEALARIKSPEHAAALLPMLEGNVTQRAAAVRALAAMANPTQADAVQRMLQDPHPTVRREAVTAIAQVAPAARRDPLAIRMLADADPTVREAAARVLTPVPSAEALAELAKQLDSDYAPLHAAARHALSRRGNSAISEATVRLAAQMLAHADPRRQEDASYLLGRLRSDATIDQHVALLNWDAANPAKADWRLIAQVTESIGLIGDPRASDRLMMLVKAAPQVLASVERPARDHMTAASANALVALARLRHRPALEESARLLQIDPLECPASVRAAAAFAIGVLSERGKPSPHVKLIAIYDSSNEAKATKFEALKALGNMRRAASAERLKSISEIDGVPELRWIAHWSYQRCADTRVPYSPPTQRRAPAVSITDASPTAQ